MALAIRIGHHRLNEEDNKSEEFRKIGIDFPGRRQRRRSEQMAAHAPAAHATYAVPTKEVAAALMYTAPPVVQNMALAIRIGHHRLKEDNKSEEFRKIGIDFPGPYTGSHDNVNDPVYQFSKAALQFPTGTWEIPGPSDCCFAVSATANSNHDPAPYVALKIMGSKCDHWTKVGVGVCKEGDNGYQDCDTLVTGVGHCKLKHSGVSFNPTAQRNSDQPNSWKDMGHSMFHQLMKLLAVPVDQSAGSNRYTKGYMYGCTSQNYAESHAASQQMGNRGHGHLQSSWGCHEAWLQVLQVAEMAVILHSIADGGSVFVKVRIFQSAATKYVCALLASLFETFEVVPVPQQVCGFVLAHYGKKRAIAKQDVAAITNYLLEQCLDSTAMVFAPPRCLAVTKEALYKVETASCAMEKYKDDSLHMLVHPYLIILHDKFFLLRIPFH
jgi:hypothetical protein